MQDPTSIGLWKCPRQQRGCREHPAQGTPPACYVQGSVEATGTSSARVLARLLSLLAPSHGQLGTQCAEGTGCVFAQGAWSPAWDKGPLCPQPSWLVRPHWPLHGAPPPSLPCDPSTLSTALSLLSTHSYHLASAKPLPTLNALRPPTLCPHPTSLSSPPPPTLPTALPSTAPPGGPKSTQVMTHT